MLFWNYLAFSMIQQILAIWFLVPLPFPNPVCTSGSSWFVYYSSQAWRIWGITLLTCEMNTIVWQFEHSLALPFFGSEMKIWIHFYIVCMHFFNPWCYKRNKANWPINLLIHYLVLTNQFVSITTQRKMKAVSRKHAVKRQAKVKHISKDVKLNQLNPHKKAQS